MMAVSEHDQEEGVRRVEIHPGIWIDVPRAQWNDKDRAAWHWPPKIKCSSWVEKYRRLDKGAIPGPWRNDNAPYLRGIMDLACIRGIIRESIKKAAQMGVSEAMRGLMGYWGHMDPAPMGLALPNRDKGRQIVETDILPFFKSTYGRWPDLSQLLSPRLHDMKKGMIKLANEFVLFLMWSGSETSMASDPMKRALSDEVNKFQAWTGGDADPISLIEKRMRTFPDRIHILVSTPTTSDGQISQYFNASQVKLYFLVSCPYCQVRQRLLFGQGGDYGIKWDPEIRLLAKEGRREEAAAKIVQKPNACWYECCNCHGPINEQQKRAAVREGKWGTVCDAAEGDRIRGDGRISDAEEVEEWPKNTTVGMQIGSQYCCWDSWTMADVAAEFIGARTMAQKFAFRTSTLGEDWEQVSESVSVESVDVRVKAATLPEGVLPKWTARLIAVVDTQNDHFWLVIRAWGPGLRSQRIWHGKVYSFEEIEQYCFRTPWANEDPRQPAWTCDKILIDSGGTRKFSDDTETETALPSRVMDVYQWALKNKAMVNVIKGDAKPQAGIYIRRGQGTYVTDKEKKPVPIWLLDVHHFHDHLADLMAKEVDEMDPVTGEVTGQRPLWALNTRLDPEYHQHLANMRKVQERDGHNLVEKWRPLRDGVRVDYRACEAYQVAGAYQTGVHLLPDMPHFMEAREAEIHQRLNPVQPMLPIFQTPDGRPFVATKRE